MLQQQLGIDPLDLDLMFLHHPEVFRLSVRQSIEPVVGYLRSQGLSGSALAYVLSHAPTVLSRSVEDELMPLCNFLREQMGNKAMGLVVRYPALLEASHGQLLTASQALYGAGAAQNEISFMIWRYPSLCVRLGDALELAEWLNAGKGDKALEAATAVAGGGNAASIERIEFRNAIAEELEHISSALVALKNALSEESAPGKPGLDTTASDRQLKRAVAAIEEYAIEDARLRNETT